MTEREELEMLELKELEDRESLSAQQPTVSKIESAARGFGQGVTLGWQDELSALAERGMAKLDPTLSKENYQEMYTQPGQLEQSRKEYSAENEAARAANPWTYGASNVAGNLVTGIAMPGSNTASGMAGIGALTSFGTSEGGLKDRAEDALIGAGIGTVGGIAANKIIEGTTPFLRDLVAKNANRMLGFSKGILKKAGGIDRVEELVGALRKKGLFKKGVSSEQIASRIEDIGNEAGEHIGRTFDDIGEVPLFNRNELTQRVEKDVGISLRNAKEINKNEISQLEDVKNLINRRSTEKNVIETVDTAVKVRPDSELDFATLNEHRPIYEQRLVEERPMTFKDLWELKKDLGDKAWQKGVTNENLKVYQDAWKTVSSALDENLELLGQSNLRPDIKQTVTGLRDANMIFTASKEASKALDDKLLGEVSKNSPFTMAKIFGSGLGGLIGHSPMGAMAGYAAGAAAERYGNQAAVIGFNALENALSKAGPYTKVLQEAAKRGTSAMTATIYSLYQNDQEFRKLMEEDVKE